MDNLDKYFKACDRIAGQMWPDNRNPVENINALFEKEVSEILELIQIRKSFLDEKDYNTNGGFLQVGYFNGASSEDRLAGYCFVSDLTTSLMKLDFEKRFKIYKPNQEIFLAESTLWNQIRTSQGGKQDLELIKLSSLEHISNSEIFKFKDTYLKSDFALNPILIEWVKNNFSMENIYVRIDPNESYSYRPPQRLYESILQPANPNWWKELTIRPRGHEGAAYKLDDCEPQDNYQQYWEKYIKKIDRLEIKANRGPDDLLSVLIEEVSTIDGNGLMINRVIHMDTNAPLGTKFEDTTLAHLDIAIYLYKDENALKRSKIKINEGIRSEDADYKCHLIRVENISFKSLFGFSELFLKSKTLLYEWINDQFENYKLEQE